MGRAIPGTDQSKSMIAMPIISSDRVLGMIGIENYERENAYGESELRLLGTIAASLGTALENARLFDETQRLFKADQQRAAELAVINSIQQGMADEARLSGHRRSGRRQAARGVPYRRYRHPLVRRRYRPDALPVPVRAWNAALPYRPGRLSKVGLGRRCMRTRQPSSFMNRAEALRVWAPQRYPAPIRASPWPAFRSSAVIACSA